jgi:hypothetical protein
LQICRDPCPPRWQQHNNNNNNKKKKKKNFWGREREREERNGEVVRDTTFWGGVRKKETIFPVLKAPRQCPLVLLVDAAHMIGIRLFFFM